MSTFRTVLLYTSLSLGRCSPHDDPDDRPAGERPSLVLPWHVDPPTVNIQLDQDRPFPSSAQSITIHAQRGECEGVQVWLPAIAEGNGSLYDGELQNVRVTVGDLARTDKTADMDAGTAELSRELWQYYQQGYVNASGTHAYECMCGANCSTPCYCGCGHECDPYPRPASANSLARMPAMGRSHARAGWYPSYDWYADPLLPLRNGEAVPRVQVQDTSCFKDNGCNRTCWRGRVAVSILTEVCVPRSAVPGNYSGSAKLVFESRDASAPPRAATIEIPVALEVWPLTLPETNASGAFSTVFNWGQVQPRYVGTPNGPDAFPHYDIYGFHCGHQTTAHRGKGGYYPNLTYEEGTRQWLPFLTEHRIPAFNLYGGWDGTVLNVTTNTIVPNPVPCFGLDWYQMLADNGAKHLNLMLVPKCQGCNESALNATIRSTLRQLEPAVTALTKAGLIDKAVVYGFDEMPAVYNNSLRRIYGAIKERFPMVKTMATLNAWVGWAEMDPSLPVDIWVETYNDGPQAQPIRAQQLPRWLKAGKQYCKLTRA
jgi:hypothetical protein